MSRVALSLAALLLLGASAGHAKAADKISITTGISGGLYFTAGEAICRALAASPSTASLPCSAVVTSGSISNILELNPKTAQFAIVQADAQYNAVAGLGLFAATGPDEDLRSVFSIHMESFGVLVRADSKVVKFDDLRGSKMSAGQIGTGTRETAEALFEALNWTKDDRANVVDMPVNDQNAALCEGRVDAAAFLTGHPAPIITDLTRLCAVKLVPVSPETSEKLARTMLYYLPTTISGGTYPGIEQPTNTIGVRTALVTTATVPDQLVRAVTEAVFSNLDIIREPSPAFADLRPDQMSSTGLIAPLHAGAAEYYRAVGLPMPSVEIVPSGKSPISGDLAPGNGVLSLDPKLKAPAARQTDKAQKPAYTTVPVGPDDKWQLEAGDFGNKSPALTGDGDLPAAQDNIRLKIPVPE